ncbi:MAG: proton-conducting transporter membrane subunit [Mucinivorans sp.]
MLISLFLLAAVSILFVCISPRRDFVLTSGLAYFVAQGALAAYAVNHIGKVELAFFEFDALGVTYFCLMAVVGLLVAWRSFGYLSGAPLRHCKIYFTALISLSLSVVGVYLSQNIAVGWIFLEATTIATAALTYHRRTRHSLEATWKYLFVSSVGIAIAYLGILLLSTSIPEGGSLNYSSLSQAVMVGNPLYMKLAFIFLLVGYSTKLELFPLFTVGVDANHESPAPCSAFISSALVGAGYVSLIRGYHLFGHIAWVRSVLLIVGVISLILAAVYIGRTGNFKRLFAFSTLENSGLVALGLGLGGVGVWAAVLHSMAHTLIKGVIYLQLSVVGRMYGSYKVGKIGNLMRADPMGGAVMVAAVVALLAMPPSVLFRTEYMMLSQMAFEGQWWLILPVVAALLMVMYWLLMKIFVMLYRPSDLTLVDMESRNPLFSGVLLLVLSATLVGGVWLGPELENLITVISYAK